MVKFARLGVRFVSLETKNSEKMRRGAFLSLVVLTLIGGILTVSFGMKDKENDRKRVEISTEYGKMVVELFNETPGHRDNFVKLAKEGFYNDLLFHRVISEFMVQGGDPDSKGAEPGARLGQGGPGYTIPAEIVPGKVHLKGALAAARQGDQVNPEKRSSGSQFYIVHGRTFSAEDLKRQVESKKNRYYQTKSRAYFADPAHADAMERFRKASAEKDVETLAEEEAKLKAWVDSKFGPSTVSDYSPEQLEIYSTVGGAPHLDGDYTVFGQVVSGLEIIDKIAAVETDGAARPLKDIKISVKVIE